MLYAVTWNEYDNGGLETLVEGPENADFGVLQHKYINSLSDKHVLENDEQFVSWLIQQEGWSAPVYTEVDSYDFDGLYYDRRTQVVNTFGNQPGRYGARRPVNERCPGQYNHYWKATIKDNLCRVWICSFCGEEVEPGNEAKNQG